MLSIVDISFTEWLNSEMKKRGWSQSDLARAANLSRGSISHVINGTRNPGTEFCEAVAKAFRLPPEVVFRAAGLLPPAHEETTDLALLNHLFSKLSPEDREDILSFIETRVRRQEEREKARQRKPGKTVTDS